MIRVFNSAQYRQTGDERFIPLSEVNIVTQKIDTFTGAPYILFEHRDFHWAACMPHLTAPIGKQI